MTFNHIQAITELRTELRELIKQRDHIERRMSDVNLALRSFTRMLTDEKQRESLLAELEQSRRKPAGLTEVIATFLSNSPHHYHSANDVREWLDREGFDLSDYSQPLATIATTLRRLEESERVKAIRKGRNVAYKWADPTMPATGKK